MGRTRRSQADRHKPRRQRDQEQTVEIEKLDEIESACVKGRCMAFLEGIEALCAKAMTRGDLVEVLGGEMRRALLPREPKQPINRVKRHTKHQRLQTQRLAQDVAKDIVSSPMIGFVVSDAGEGFLAAVLGFYGEMADRTHGGVEVGLQERFDRTQAIVEVSVFDVKDAFFGIVPRAEVELLVECRKKRVTMGFEGDLADLLVEEALNGREVEFGVVVSGDDVDLVTSVHECHHRPKDPRIQRDQMA